MKIYPIKTLWLLLLITPLLLSCGVELDEDNAQSLMEKIYKTRKSGKFREEFKYYSRDDFEIVPFKDISSSLSTVINSSGGFISARHISTKTTRRNQLGKGLTNYVVLTYQAKYVNMNLQESYYFLGDSKTPKLVYVELAF